MSAPASSAQSARPDGAVQRGHRVGETAVASDYTLSLSELKTCDKTVIAPRPGNLRLGVRVEIAGKTEHEVPVNPFYARLVDQDRDGYAYAATFGGCEPALKSAHVSKGQSLSGWITFEIPEKAKGLELTYSPYILNRGDQSVKFVLGR